MVVKLVFLALFSVAFAHGGSQFLSGRSTDEDTLFSLTDVGLQRISETMTSTANAPQEWGNYTIDRKESLQWDCSRQKNAVNKNIMEAVAKGMDKSKKLSYFQCVATKGREGLEKLIALENGIPKNIEDLLQKGITGLNPLKMMLREFSNYVKDLRKTKAEELNKAPNTNAKNKVIEEVKQKMRTLDIVLSQTNDEVRDEKYKFFENFIQYSLATENAIKKIQREAADKIKNCLNKS